jgi:hypothetical protein
MSKTLIIGKCSVTCWISRLSEVAEDASYYYIQARFQFPNPPSMSAFATGKYQTGSSKAGRSNSEAKTDLVLAGHLSQQAIWRRRHLNGRGNVDAILGYDFFNLGADRGSTINTH